MWIT